MPGTYVVNYTDPSNGQITVEPVTLNNSTSVVMVGYRYPVYGEAVWENFLHLMEHFACKTPPSSPVTGQIWADTTTSPVIPKVYDKSTGKWHEIGTSVTISITAPLSTKGLWYNPSTNGLYYWNGAKWTNILCFVIANTTDFNDIAIEFNFLLRKYGQTEVTLLTGAAVANAAQWTALTQRIKQIALYRRVPQRITDRLNFDDMTRFCSDDPAGTSLFTIIRQYDRLLRAIDLMESCCGEVDSSCYDMKTPPSGTRIRTTAWDAIDHIATLSWASQQATAIYFDTGGKVIWNGSLATSAPGTSSTNRVRRWEAFLASIADVEISATRTIQNGIQTGVGVNQLTATEQVLFTKSGQTIYYSYHYQSTASVTITGKKVAGVVTFTVRFTDPDPDSITGTLTSTFTLLRVGAPCLDMAPAFPTIISTGSM